ncbi:MAG: O-antigen ligase family protein [Candidatus Schekmanbacteria bacterium]|nr:O-antigen ligase family protein [Candidatus Schekmanbacteria bacterium]
MAGTERFAAYVSAWKEGIRAEPRRHLARACWVSFLVLMLALLAGKSWVWLLALLFIVADPPTSLAMLAACSPFFGLDPASHELYLFDIAQLSTLLCVALHPQPARRVEAMSPATVGFMHSYIAVAGICALPVMMPTLAAMGGWLPAAAARGLTVNDTSPLFPYRVLFNLVLGAGIFQACRRWLAANGGALKQVAGGLIVGLLLTVSYGLLRHFDVVVITALDHPLVTHTGRVRLQSFFGNSGWLAEYLAVATPAVVVLILSGVRAQRIPMGLALFPVSLCVLLSQQRGGLIGWVGGIASCAAAWWLGERRRSLSVHAPARHVLRRLYAAAIAGGALVLFAATALGLAIWEPGLATRLASLLDLRHLDLSDRKGLWDAALGMFAANPLAGAGVGGYQRAYDCYRASSETLLNTWLHGTAHNTYLHVMAESGVLGIVPFAAFTAGLLAASWTASRQASEPAQRLAGAASFGAIVAFCLLGLVDHMFFIQAVTLLFWGSAGTAVGIAEHCGKSSANRPGHEARSRAWRVLPAALPAAAVLVLLISPRAPCPSVANAPTTYLGAYHAERWSDERLFRWTRGDAVILAPDCGNRDLVIPVRPGPGRVLSPRLEVAVSVPGRDPVDIRLMDDRWYYAVIPASPATPLRAASQLDSDFEQRFALAPERIPASGHLRRISLRLSRVWSPRAFVLEESRTFGAALGEPRCLP